MEATESKDEQTKEHCYEGTEHTNPVPFGDHPVNFTSAQLIILRVVSQLVVVNHDISYAQSRKHNNSQRQMHHKNVE